MAADLIGGFDGTATDAFGSSLPVAPVGGGYKMGDSRVGAGVYTITRQGLYVTVEGNTIAYDDTVAPLTASQAARMDRRLDDGNPNAGTFVGDNTATTCVGAAGDTAYDETVNNTCGVAYRVR